MDTAGREAASRKARLTGDGYSIAKRCNTADGRFPTRPEGATQNVDGRINPARFWSNKFNPTVRLPKGMRFIYMSSSIDYD